MEEWEEVQMARWLKVEGKVGEMMRDSIMQVLRDTLKGLEFEEQEKPLV